MTAKCFPVIRLRTVRATKINACGVVQFGDCARVISDGIVSVAVTSNTDDGEAITVKNAWGVKCVNVPANPELDSLQVDVTFCQVDPELYSMMTGYPVVYDPASGDAIGYYIDRAIKSGDVNFALEGWSSAQGVTGCAGDETAPWAYFLWKHLKGATIGDYTLENNAVTFTASGAVTVDSDGWGAGPYDVLTDDEGDPSPLYEALPATVHQYGPVRTLVQPPDPDFCGCLPLDDPEAAAVTGATAGIPGTWTPADRNRPDTLAALQAGSITASPLTAWVTGQYVLLEDGSTAYWDSDSWEAGEAP